MSQLGLLSVYVVGMALVAAVAPIVGYLLTRPKLQEIHTLVNDRMDRALKRIDDLEKLVKHDSESDPGSTAESLRSPSGGGGVI